MGSSRKSRERPVSRPPPAERHAPPERETLAAEIVRALEERGVPPGTWLVDIGRTREALQEADALLRRLEEAIIRAASVAPRLDP